MAVLKANNRMHVSGATVNRNPLLMCETLIDLIFIGVSPALNATLALSREQERVSISSS